MNYSIPDKSYFRIGEVSKILEVESYVLRYWETEFPSIRPIRTKSGQRLYRRKDVITLINVKRLLYEELYTIAGARKKLDEMRKEKTNAINPNERLVHELKMELLALRKLL